MLPYKDLQVSYHKPKVWRKPTMAKAKPQRSYVDVLKEEKEFQEYKVGYRNEVTRLLDQSVNPTTTVGEMSQRTSGLYDYLGKSLIFDNDMDSKHLLTHANKITLNKKLQGWCKQLNENIEHITEKGYGILGIRNQYKDVPAFVCAAGPSLKNNMKELQKVGDKGIIIAVDTSFRPLLEAGIKPHLVMAHDANHNGAKFFLPADYFPKDTNLNNLNKMGELVIYKKLLAEKEEILKKWNYDTIGVFVNYVSPITIASFCGDTIAFYGIMDDSLPVYNTMIRATSWHKDADGKYEPYDRGAILGGSSVGHTAFYLAHLLGCNPITLVGLDLSYPEGKNYVDGASNQKDMSKIKMVDVEDLSGKKVQTNVSMFSYRTVFEQMLPHLITMGNLTVYNATEHLDGSFASILEVGAEPRRLSEVIKEHCINDVPKIKEMKNMIRNWKG